jgi:hypothetical protein
MHFETVFDLERAGCAFLGAPFGLLLIGVPIGIASLIVVGILFPNNDRVATARILGFGFMALIAFMATVSAVKVFRDHKQLRLSVARGTYSTVEGEIQNLTTRRPKDSRHTESSFHVAQTEFRLRNSVQTLGRIADFHRLRLADGHYVRIAHIDQTIVRVDLRKP